MNRFLIIVAAFLLFNAFLISSDPKLPPIDSLKELPADRVIGIKADTIANGFLSMANDQEVGFKVYRSPEF